MGVRHRCARGRSTRQALVSLPAIDSDRARPGKRQTATKRGRFLSMQLDASLRYHRERMSALGRRSKRSGFRMRHSVLTRRRQARWWLISGIVALLALALMGPGSSLSGSTGWLRTEASASAPLETLG